MAAVASAADQTADLKKKLSINSHTKTHDAADSTKKPSSLQRGSSNGGGSPKVAIPPREQTLTPLLQEMMDPNVCYIPSGYPSHAYYIEDYGGSMANWDYHRYMNHEGVYGDTYQDGYGYASYDAYGTAGSGYPAMLHDGQLYGTQQYQYPTQYYQAPVPPTSSYTHNRTPTSQGEVATSAGAGHPPQSVDTAKATPIANAEGIPNGKGGSVTKQSLQKPSTASYSSYGRGAMTGGRYSNGIYGNGVSTGQHPLSSDVSNNSSSASLRTQNQRPLPHSMGLNAARPASGLGPAAPAYLNKIYSNNQLYGPYGNVIRSGSSFGANSYNSRIGGRWNLDTDNKYKPRVRDGLYGYVNENFNGLSELNRGPRSCCFRSPNTPVSKVTIALKGQNLPLVMKEDSTEAAPDKEQYNREDFCEEYSDAKFFIIKSYSEDDIHKSVRYSVWASTPNGNKKLDAAYQEAQAKAGKCPVFLLFSVNTSGQFVGLAEMVGPVDFNKTVDYWQQDKWFGCFPVKWHIVKDIPNSILKHIILEYNENKPVTNSRDTQEVKLEQGTQMLKLFKEHVSKTSILDDFGFYENRQKLMQEKRAKQEQFRKQVLDAKETNRVANEKKGDLEALQKSLESVSILKGSAAGEPKPIEGVVAGDSLKVLKEATEQQVGVNGVANGC